MMNSDYGLQLGQALRAVASLHADTSRLLLDCDKHIGKGRKSLFGNFVTRDLTYNVRANFWMPEGVFRYYEAGGLAVDAVTATFFMPVGSENPDLVPQPLFQLGRIQYDSGWSGFKNRKEPDAKDACDPWDLWWLFFKGGRTVELDRLLELADADGGRIAWARYIAVPLVSISSIDDVTRLMDVVTQRV